jgi:hypothetical protein
LARLRGTQAGNFVPFLAVYQGSVLTNLSIVSSTNEVIGHTRQLRFQAVQGQTYALALAGAKYDTNAFPHINDDVFGLGRFEFNFAILGIRITNLVAVPNATNGVDFSATARVEHFGTATTGPLRFRLVARQGLSKSESSGANVVNDVQVALGVFTLPPPGQAAPGISGPVPIGGTCPAPTEGAQTSGTGWEVFCLLEEQVGTNWFLKDKLLVLQGIWPQVGGFGGPGGGVIRLDPIYVGLSEFNPLNSVVVLGPSTVVEGRSTNYTGVASYADGTVLSFTNTAWSASQFNITTNGVFTAGSVASNTIVTLDAPYEDGGLIFTATTNVTVLNLPSPVITNLNLLGNTGLTFTLNGVPGRSNVIEATTNLAPPALWLPLATNAPASGLFNFTNFSRTNFSLRFFRAREL